MCSTLATLANFFTCILFVSASAERWVIDTDVGADDATAIFTFLQLEKSLQTVELIGLTAVQGNTHVDNVARNILKVLDTVNRLDIPVYKGANKSVLITPPSDNFFGNDGFGDFQYPNPPSEDYIQDMHAVNYLTSIVKANPGEINLLAIGPLTNVALAARMDQTFLKNLKSLYVLGGSVKGIGNARPGVEFNFYCDPEAVFIVIDEILKNEKIINLMSWETAVEAGIPKEWRKNVFGQIASPLINIINKAENTSSDSPNNWITSDTLATLWAIDPNFPVATYDVSAQIETSAGISRGAVMLDYSKTSNQFPQLLIATPGSLNVTYIQEKLFNTFSNYTPTR